MVQAALEGFDSIFAPELTDEERRRMDEAAASGSPAGTTETPLPTAPLPGTTATSAKDPTKPITEKGNGPSGGLTAADLLAQQQELALKDATDQQALLNAQIAQQALLYEQNQKAILQAQQNASNALNQGFLSLTDAQKTAMAAAEELRKNTGQASRKPNYSVSLKANKTANSRGVGSTMLTGPGGIATAALPLGKATVLGS